MKSSGWWKHTESTSNTGHLRGSDKDHRAPRSQGIFMASYLDRKTKTPAYDEMYIHDAQIIG